MAKGLGQSRVTFNQMLQDLKTREEKSKHLDTSNDEGLHYLYLVVSSETKRMNELDILFQRLSGWKDKEGYSQIVEDGRYLPSFLSEQSTRRDCPEPFKIPTYQHRAFIMRGRDRALMQRAVSKCSKGLDTTYCITDY